MFLPCMPVQCHDRGCLFRDLLRLSVQSCENWKYPPPWNAPSGTSRWPIPKYGGLGGSEAMENSISYVRPRTCTWQPCRRRIINSPSGSRFPCIAVVANYLYTLPVSRTAGIRASDGGGDGKSGQRNKVQPQPYPTEPWVPVPCEIPSSIPGSPVACNAVYCNTEQGRADRTPVQSLLLLPAYHIARGFCRVRRG